MMVIGTITTSVMIVSNGLNKKRFTIPERSALPKHGSPKALWREWAREQTSPDLVQVSSLISGNLSSWLRGGATVLLYLPMRGEVDLRELEQLHLNLVTTRTPETGWLTVHSWGSEREDHRWGFEQPIKDAPLFQGQVDVALVPGLAFDVSGGRLGNGKGYYDQLLARINPPIRVGIAISSMIVPQLPAEAHDIPMTHLASEIGVQAVKAKEDN